MGLGIRRTTAGMELLTEFEVKGICDDTPEEFVEHIDNRVARILENDGGGVQLFTNDVTINLFGFGEVVAYAMNGENQLYFWLHDAAKELDWDINKAVDWANKEISFQLEDQRAIDEERGELGYECLSVHRMSVTVYQGNGERDRDDTSLKHWHDLYLVNDRRLMALMASSPHGKQFMDNVIPLMSMAMDKTGLLDNLSDVKTYTKDDSGEAVDAGYSLGSAIRSNHLGYTEEQAVERALRGIAVPNDLGTLLDNE